MKIAINNAQSVRQIKEKFAKAYPYLKLEFFHPRNGDPFLRENQVVKLETKIGEIRNSRQTGYITITSGIKANTLEKHFLDDYGLYVQVFRKAGQVWLVTTSSGEQTLAALNAKGQELSKPVPSEDLPEDIHEQL